MTVLVFSWSLAARDIRGTSYFLLQIFNLKKINNAIFSSNLDSDSESYFSVPKALAWASALPFFCQAQSQSIWIGTEIALISISQILQPTPSGKVPFKHSKLYQRKTKPYKSIEGKTNLTQKIFSHQTNFFDPKFFFNPNLFSNLREGVKNIQRGGHVF